jgi:5,10-methylenetetrahydrofolate reductase/ferredoxin
MIITEKKPFEEILSFLEDEQKIFIVGCGDCAALCQTGGARETEELAGKLIKAGKFVTGWLISEGPCHDLRIARELRTADLALKQAEGIVVLSCGAGIQAVTELTDKPVHPGLNTLFLGNVKRYGSFEERCSLCGECILDDTGGICPVTRCAKALVNGPCGGVKDDGMCEIADRICAWKEIFEKLQKQGRLHKLLKYQTMKDFERSVKPGRMNLKVENQDERSQRLMTQLQEREVKYQISEFGRRNWQIKLEEVKAVKLTRLQRALEAGQSVTTVEIVPPKGVNVELQLGYAENLKSYVTAVNVNENPASVMRTNSLSMCSLFIQRGIEPVLHITSRERNRLAIQSELLGASILGIKNVMVMTGDHQSMGDHKEAKPVYDVDSVQLLRLITEMMGGKDYNGNDLDGAPQFYPGAVVNPGGQLPEMQILKMRKKALAGARFSITQAIFDLEKLADFLKMKGEIDAFIIAGIIPLKSGKMARFMNSNVPGIKVPEKLIEIMDKSKNKTQDSIAIARDLVQGCRQLCQGVHLMPIGAYNIVPAILGLE